MNATKPVSRAGIQRWFFVHKWTSILCTAFLLMSCITGLPLIFHHEIDELTRAPKLGAASVTSVDLDELGRRAVGERPGWHLMFLAWDADKPLISAVIGPTLDATEDEAQILLFDSRSGARVSAPPADEGVMAFILDLHAHLLLSIPGQLLLGLVGLLFIASLVSGVVLYVPFMRKLAFGSIRKERSTRVKWLDTHNLIGIVTLGWLSAVAFTGVFLTLTTPITALWQIDELAEIAAPYKGDPLPTHFVPIEQAIAAARAAVPDGEVSFVAWPGTAFSTDYHYMVALKGKTPLTERLLTPAMIEVDTGQIADVRGMPWYMKGLFLSAPLHFGDYGHLPLKIVWALLDIATIVLLWTGLYLWLYRGRAVESRVELLATRTLKDVA